MNASHENVPRRKAERAQQKVSRPTPVSSLLAGENKALLVGRDALLVLDLLLHVVDRVGRLDIERDGLARESLDEDLRDKKSNSWSQPPDAQLYSSNTHHNHASTTPNHAPAYCPPVREKAGVKRIAGLPKTADRKLHDDINCTFFF